MANEIFNKDELAVEVIATGSTLDNDPGYQGKIFEIRTWTFRLNHIGLNEWSFSEPIFWKARYFEDEEARREYEEKKAEKEKRREDLENGIRLLLGARDDVGLKVTQNVSEIFTAVQIREVKTEEPKKTSVAELLQRSASMLNAMLCCMI